MNYINRMIAVAFAAAILPQTVMAQQTFNEISYSAGETVFRLNAPTAQKHKVQVRIYNEGQGGKAVQTVNMKVVGADRWEVTVKGNLEGKFYTFNIGRGECPGVFAKAVGINGQRGAIIDMKQTDPEGWENDRRPEVKSPADLVIYEMHWRDFSIDASSDLQHKGKFLALTEPKAIEHLKNLGINAIHILPSFDYASVDETQLTVPQYNWGYDPKNYNVPAGSYSTDPFTPAVRIKEFKQMVQALHKAGIRVVLDVVYNHTFDIKNSNFQLTYPDVYYRKTADGTYSDGSGCGNETASERPLMRQFMLESVKYWIDEYHIDGFRFDLMGIHDIETMLQIRDAVNWIDPSIYIYGEGWSAGTCAYPQEKLAMKARTYRLNGIGAFSDDMRDALRGPFSDDTKGAFLAGIAGEEESLKFGIVGGIAHPQVDMTKVNYDKKPWTAQPTQHISYVSCHDDMCLVDRLKASVPGLQDNSKPEYLRMAELIRLDLLAQTAVFTSQGVPLILSGEEMLRDKKGVHNSFNSPDSINCLDWDNLKRYPQVFDYYSRLIRLRKNHPAFRLAEADKVRRHLEFLKTEDCLVAFQLKDLKGIDSCKRIVVVLNGNKSAKTVNVPQGSYTIVCNNAVINEEGMGTMEGSRVQVDAQSALILFEK
ncbi:type I pullulanase [Xylanibacter rodentium]|uniref:type I pullulanase n=1 Tax=Xylanibacter rodentium TaxID=2736289 RepID=UPI00258397E2|nr:type I pullulanase [Xylanibacter rodentium]